MRSADLRGARTPPAIVLAWWALAYAVALVVLRVVGSHVRLTDLGAADASGALVPATRQLLGRPDPHDFYVDFASAHAMLHGQNAYSNSNILFRGLGPAWAVRTANPHPPTLLPLVAPFTLFHYAQALAAWALLMTFLYVATVRLLGVRLSYSIAVGVGIAVTFPGAFGIGNPVPIVAFAVALAFRFRYHPALAGLGIALAAVPKGSGLLLAIPFLAAARIKTLLWAAGFYLAAALLPMLWQSDVWRQYVAHGTKAIRENADRSDNGSILRLARVQAGWPDGLTLTILVVMAVAIAFAQRDLFWSAVWLTVATLPIAWMYSLLALLPLLIFALRTSPRRMAPLVILTSAVVVGSPPFGRWPTVVFPVIVVAVGVMCALARPVEPTLWFAPWAARLPLRRRSANETPRRPARDVVEPRGHEAGGDRDPVDSGARESFPQRGTRPTANTD